MGIPALYRRFLSLAITRYNIEEMRQPSPVYSLHIDSNELIYMALQELMKDPNMIKKLDTSITEQQRLYDEWLIAKDTPNPPEYLGEFEADLCNRTIALLQSYVDEIKPVKLLNICFDGVAPMAKANQQRKRRYASILFDETNAKLSGVDSKKSFNRSLITPGSAFFALLDQTLLEKLPTLKLLKSHLDIRYSSYREEGEGEHKIATFFRDVNLDPLNNHVIVASDSDMIITATTFNTKVWVYRPSMKTNNWWSIGWLKRYLNLDWGKQQTPNPELSFMVALSVLGNDFIPSQPSYYPWSSNDYNFLSSNKVVTESESSVESVQTIHKSLNSSMLQYEHGKLTFNWDSIKVFFMSASQQEYTRLHSIAGTRIRSNPLWSDQVFPLSLPQDTEPYMKKFVAAWYKAINLANSSSYEGSSSLYLRTLMGIDADTVFNYTDVVNDMVRKYLQSIIWSCRYQILGPSSVSMNFSYPYPIPPLLRNIANSPVWDDIATIELDVLPDDPEYYVMTPNQKMMLANIGVTPNFSTESLFDKIKNASIGNIPLFPTLQQADDDLDLFGANIEEGNPEIYTFKNWIPLSWDILLSIRDEYAVLEDVAIKSQYDERGPARLIRDDAAINSAVVEEIEEAKPIAKRTRPIAKRSEAASTSAPPKRRTQTKK